MHYADASCRAAGVWFERFEDATPAREVVLSLPAAADYESGSFYRRELPAILALLEGAECVVIDGYVHLGEERRPGLGHFVWEASGVPVIGVAKTRFAGTPPECALMRGGSARPLWVTAAGLQVEEALLRVGRMHGPYRLPTLLKRVDQLARAAVPPSCRAPADGCPSAPS